MFQSLPHTFQKHGLQADVRTLLHLHNALEKGLIHTIGDIYLVLKGLVTRDPKDIGPFTVAFYDYFLNIEIQKGEPLDAAIMRSDSFNQWKEAFLELEQLEKLPDMSELVDRYLEEVHLSSFDIQQLLKGSDILNEDNPNMTDDNPNDNSSLPEQLQRMADYRDIAMEELLKRMEQVAKQQKGRHVGGSHWIGQGGISPYGNGGAAAGGIRVGGVGGGKMARAVINDRKFYPVDTKALLQDDNMDAALAILKGIEDESTEQLLDVPLTIKEGLKQGGIFLPYIKEKIHQKVQVILLIDNGGYSMTPYVRSIQKLFSKMKTRFAHDLTTYYFHNTMYKGVYTDMRRTKFETIEAITSKDKNYSVFVIGDADMAPYELNKPSIESWIKLQETYKRTVWLNPTPERYWDSSDTIPYLKEIIEMFPMTPDGLEKAIQYMNRHRKYNKR